MSIKEQIRSLAKLQALDIDIQDIKRRLAGIPDEQERLVSRRDELHLAVERAEDKIDTLKKEYRSLESDSQSVAARIEKEDEKLRSVKTNKEYQALLTGIDHLKADRSRIEDRMIEVLEAIDTAAVELAGEKEAFNRLDAQLAHEKKVLDRQAEEKRQQLKALEEQKSRLVGDIDPELLKRYRHVKVLKGDGLAVVSVQDAVCKGCHMNIPPQLYNELQRFDRLLICPNCQRIIYPDVPGEAEN